MSKKISIVKLHNSSPNSLNSANSLNKNSRSENSEIYQQLCFSQNPGNTIKNDIPLYSKLDKALKNTIKQFQLFENKFQNSGHNVVSNLVTELKKYQKELNPKISESCQTNPIKRKEKILSGLKEIFIFYCKQQFSFGKHPTFELIDHELSTMTLGGFTKFCLDFEIRILPSKIKEIFKKYALYGINLCWEDFIVFFIFFIKILENN